MNLISLLTLIFLSGSHALEKNHSNQHIQKQVIELLEMGIEQEQVIEAFYQNNCNTNAVRKISDLIFTYNTEKEPICNGKTIETGLQKKQTLSIIYNQATLTRPKHLAPKRIDQNEGAAEIITMPSARGSLPTNSDFAELMNNSHDQITLTPQREKPSALRDLERNKDQALLQISLNLDISSNCESLEDIKEIIKNSSSNDPGLINEVKSLQTFINERYDRECTQGPHVSLAPQRCNSVKLMESLNELSPVACNSGPEKDYACEARKSIHKTNVRKERAAQGLKTSLTKKEVIISRFQSLTHSRDGLSIERPLLKQHIETIIKILGNKEVVDCEEKN